MRKKTTEEFKKEVYALTGDEYSVLGEYIGSQDKILMRHNTCGYVYEIKSSDFLRGHRCQKCSTNALKTTEKFKKEVFDLVGDEYEVLGEYTGANDKILMRHNKCGYEWDVRASHILQGTGCPKCHVRTKATEQFKQEVLELVGEEYIVLGEYVSAKTKILMKHKKCGYEYLVTPDSFLRGRKCSKCFGGVKKSQAQFEKEVFNLVGDEYYVLGEYISSRTKIKMRHNLCGYEYLITPDSFLHGTRCIKCRCSKGEKKIEKFLNANSIVFEKEKTFENLRDKYPLRFDFYLPERNICIEYDGEQHFVPVKFGGISQERAEENFKSCQRRDRMKDAYCKERNIRLIRIPYTELKNIKKILKNNIVKEK